MRKTFARTLTAVLATIVLLVQGTWVLAGTTGSINGTVTDTQTGAPIVGAHVGISSPSQQGNATTDAQGRFTFLSLAPDTYTFTITAPGYEALSQAGFTVQADNGLNLNFRTSKQLARIGGTTARANTDLVKPGTTADVYSINATQAAAAAGLGGGGSLNAAYSAIASVPGVFVPQGQQGWAQAVYVRGGNYTQLGYEYDGVPVQRAYDAYPSSTLSALGQQEVQVYTGSQPGSAQSSGLAGFVNQVIKTGTHPGTATAQGGFGFPTFYHKGQIEFGGASPDRNFSYYIATAGYDQGQREIDQFDGGGAFGTGAAFSPGITFAAIAQNCQTPQATAGCYQNNFSSAPNGYAYLPGAYGGNQQLGDRESVLNLHFGIPHKKDGTRDDIQVLSDVSYLFLQSSDSFNALGRDAQQVAQTGTLNYGGQTLQPCDPSIDLLAGPNPACIVLNRGNGGFGSAPAGGLFNYGPNGYLYPSRSIYTGPLGSALTAANIGQVQQYIYPASPNGIPVSGPGFATPVDPAAGGTEKINDAIFKLQYTHAMGTNAYARIYGYSLYSDWLNNDPNAYSDPNFSFIPSDYILPTHTRGIGLTLADQIGNHLLNLTGGYNYAKLSRWNGSFSSSNNPVAVLVDSTNPTGGCYTAGLTLASCNGLLDGAPGAPLPARYTVPGTNAAPTGLVARSNGGITVANASTFTCGNGPCEYLGVGSGLGGSFNDVTPRFANLALSDTWNVTPKLTLDAAVRYDSFRYDLPSGGTAEGPNPQAQSALARTLFTNSYNAFHCNMGVGNIVGTLTPNSCPAGTQLAFSNQGASSFWYGGFQPRVGATFTVNPLNVVRAGYGRYLQPTSSAYLFYNRAGADIASYDAPKFVPYGFTTPTHDIPPQESWNFDFSWEHQVKGSDISFKISPFIRRTRNENINVLLDPTTNFVSGIDTLSSDIKGAEFLFRKGDFNRNGFAAQLSYTYTYERSKFQGLPGGKTALDGVNFQVQTYNAYTSFCAGHPTDSRCGTALNGQPATPCYAQDGTPDGACGAASIANPYWNAPVQPLFSTSDNYFPFNQTLGTGFGSNASSYNIPHVAALILNYKHDKWAVTPTFQFTAGGRYGSPVQGIGFDPAAGGCAPLPGGTIAGDPRYPYGAPGGSTYLAQGCLGSLTTPDPFTNKFDNLGAFVEPSEIVANLGFTYQANKRLTFTAQAVNIFGTCFGGTKQAWTNVGSKNGCWYSGASGLQAGNFYNPGNSFQQEAYPYLPVVGGIAGQQAYGTGVQPLQIILSAQLKL